MGLKTKTKPGSKRRTTGDDPARVVIAALERCGFDPHPTGPDSWEGRCPVHDGDRKNLSIGRGDDGRALLHCHAHDCKPEAIVEAIGLTMADLFPPKDGHHAHKKNGKAPPKSYATLDHAIGSRAYHWGQPTGQWSYTDADDNLVAVVVRFDPPGKEKEYRPIHRDPVTGRWVMVDPPGLWPPYGLPQLGDAARIYIMEGEKSADLVRNLGVVATTTAHGAKSPHKTDLAPLAGKEIVILPDHDEEGEGYAARLVELLAKLDPRPTVKVVRLPGLAEEGDDVEEWLESVPDSWEPERCRAELERLTDAAPIEDPGPTTATGDDEGDEGGDWADEGDEAPTFREMTDEDLGIVPLSSVKEQSVRWLCKYRLERGGLALLAGDAGIGKSQVLLATVAAVTTGGDWFDGSGKAPLGNVVIVAAEDRPDRTIKPRLRALGADIGRVTIIKAKYVIREEGKPPEVHFATLQDREYWKEIFRRVDDVVLFVVDPLPSYLGRGVNDSRNTEIRAVLEPFLSEVIEPADICMFANTHLNKCVDSKTPLHRITGSIAYGAMPRNVHFVVRDPDQKDRRYFKQAKCNDAPDDLPAVAFRVERREVVTADGEVIETAIPVFEAEPVVIDLGEMVNGTKGGKRGPQPKKALALAEWVFDYLETNGPSSVGAILDAAGEAGHAGERKPNGKWSNPMAIYRAMERVPDLPEPRSGRSVLQYEAMGRGNRDIKFWRLGPATEAST